MHNATNVQGERVWDETTLVSPHAQADKARRVRCMFDAIAPTYERVNTISSLGRDRAWRRRAIALAHVRAEDVVLDIACGTGDLSRAFAAAGAGRVVGLDFSRDMLHLAAVRGAAPLQWCQSDALRLPFQDASFTIASCAFGVRNFQDLAAGLREMFRILQPGGRVVILEFSMPRGAVMRRLYDIYLAHVLPMIAGVVSGDRTGAYRYLPKSIATFVDEAGMEQLLRECGFAAVTRHPLTLGIVQIYVARKSDISTRPAGVPS